MQIKLRVEPALAFYQGRLPRYYSTRTRFERVSVVLAISGTVLSFLDYQFWMPIGAALLAAAMSWVEFNGTRGKLARYSSSVQNLGSIIRWWEGEMLLLS